MENIVEKLRRSMKGWSTKRWLLTGGLGLMAVFSMIFYVVMINQESLDAKGYLGGKTQENVLVEKSKLPRDEKESKGNDKGQETNSKKASIVVDVKGQVLHPGVYEVEAEERIGEIILEAGGFTPDADQNQVNLAKKVQDQEVIYVPMMGEEVADSRMSEGSNQTDTASGSKGNSSGSQINLNQADQQQLMSLSGIGEKKAKDIIAYREEKGSFKSIEDLKNISGIGQKTFEKLKDFIRVD